MSRASVASGALLRMPSMHNESPKGKGRENMVGRIFEKNDKSSPNLDY